MVGAVGHTTPTHLGLERMSIIHQLKLKPINHNDRKFRKHIVQSNCNLKYAIENQLKATFKRGHAYYEFTHDIENISEEKELIFMEKVIIVVTLVYANYIHYTIHSR